MKQTFYILAFCVFALSAHSGNAFAAGLPSPHGANFKLDCALCHSPDSWKYLGAASKFDHKTTSFPLTGKHYAVKCAECHKSLLFSPAPADCYDCHSDIHFGQFGDACADCHSTQGWDDYSAFAAMHQKTRFPLLGIHSQLECSLCHPGGKFVNVSSECVSCHLQEYFSTQNPAHSAVGFGQNCADCHAASQSNWAPAFFAHTPNFPLIGGHSIFDCSVCHLGVIAALSTDCFSCHQNDYNSASNPNHIAGNYPHECSVCHSINGWSPAAVNHNLTGFPLTGAHSSASCESCHIGGQYAGTPADCYFCHQIDYNNTSNPNHTQIGFPVSCADCHNTSRWTGATFNHDGIYFPIYSGEHAGTWDNCSQCHPNPGSYAVFTCLTCHTQGPTNSEHDEVSGYSYNSQACLDCHPSGGGEGD